MKLSPAQLRQLRAMHLLQLELEGRHEGVRARVNAARDYVAVLRRKLEHLPRERDAAVAAARTVAEGNATQERYDADLRHLTGQLAAARVELEAEQERLGAITVASAPLGELRERVLVSANMQLADLGLPSDGRHVPAERLSLGGA